MQIKFLGTGGAFDFEYLNSAACLRFRNKNILIDCGTTVYSRLRETGRADDIDYLLITHLHDDHVGSLASVILHHKFLIDPPRKPVILCPTTRFGDQLYAFLRFPLLKPENYVSFQALHTVPGITAVETTGYHVEGMMSFAYCFEEEKEIIAYSGDLGKPELVFDYLKTQACDSIRVFHEMTFSPAPGIHTYYRDLMPFLPHYEIYGYHLDPRLVPADNVIPLVANHPEFLA